MTAAPATTICRDFDRRPLRCLIWPRFLRSAAVPSWRREFIGLGAFPEGGYSIRVPDAVFHGVGAIEPHESQQAIVANALEEIIDLRWLVCYGRHARLGDEDRIVGES